MTNIEQL